MVTLSNEDFVNSLEKLDNKNSKFEYINVDKNFNYTKNISVDLDDLEKLSPEISNEIKQTEISDASSNKLPYKLDVRLNDLIVKIFNLSHNFFIVVRDDKIIYTNKSFLDIIDSQQPVNNEKFFKFIVKEDWNVLAKSIGEMLTGDVALNVRINSIKNRVTPVKFKAIYLPDNRHFTFILMGHKSYERDEAHGLLYDGVTGLPNYYLFEDRLQVAVNSENYKENFDKKKIGVAVISIDNIQTFINSGRQNLLLRKLAEKLVFSLNKSYTIAVGIKYQFWILMPNVKDGDFLREEAKNIAGIFEQTINDGTDELEMVASIGISMYPSASASAYKLMNKAISAAMQAVESGGNKVVFDLG